MKVGDIAPSFCAEGVETADGDTRSYRLDDLRGAPVVLAFYPADDSTVCRSQLTSYAKEIRQLTDLDATIWAISPQGVDRHRAWMRSRGEPFGFPLLADEDKAVARAYGTLGLLDLYRRYTFVIDGAGVIRWIHRSLAATLTYPLVEEIADQIRRS